MHLKQICKEILKEAKKNNIKDLKSFNKIKLNVLNRFEYKNIPKNATIASLASDKDRKQFKSILSMKPVRTISGVAPLALMTDPYPCPHTIKGIGPCTYCPGGPGSPFGTVPQSYTGKEPSTRRAIRNHYDPYLGVFNRLEHYVAMNSVPEKVDVILQGGTFNFFPYSYQEYFIKYLFKAMNDFSRLFYNKDRIDMQKFNSFFEMPADISDTSRTERIQKKLLFIKNLDLSNKKILNSINNLFFNNKNLSNGIFKQWKKFNKKNSNSIKKSNKNNFNGKNSIKKNEIKNQNESIKSILIKIKNHNDKKILLEKEQKTNETVKIRCIGLTIETRTDYGKLIQGNEMLKLGCTRIELGIQTIYDDVLKKINRGHSVKDNIDSIQILKDLGFKINAHYMPGLPETTKEMDRKGLKELFKNPDYKPDMLKIYPCMVMGGTKLYKYWKAGKFNPLTTKEAAEMIAWAKQFVPEFIRIMRVQRDIPSFLTSSGVDKTNLRQYVEKICKQKNIKCKCIRCREISLNKKNYNLKNLNIDVIEYNASNGKEFFIQAIDKNHSLFGFCRLRFPSKPLRKEITKKSALVRELHVYSTVVQIGKKSRESFQHRGIGKKLMKKAEEITKKHNRNKIVVISGIGAKQYFSKLGYAYDGPYMSKKL
ncbi:hypothetical protein CMO93_04040 [Candidatus Woesearchaeota archaeon]|nr:hypothetical protein [Candidatus Woesearchaeota archaeon]|tara:strand:- start:1834 stop:3786 length:1953 start_codon:yes stop_codon:yes gene_type:complete